MSSRNKLPCRACAVIKRSDRPAPEVLIGKNPCEPYEGRWTFPGGPVDAGEVPEAGLRRALRSLLRTSVRIVVGQPPFDASWDNVMCRWRFFFCDGTGCEVQNLHFSEIRWVVQGDLREYEYDPVSQQVVDWILDDDR